jgi:hypothetical protein
MSDSKQNKLEIFRKIFMNGRHYSETYISTSNVYHKKVSMNDFIIDPNIRNNVCKTITYKTHLKSTNPLKN